MSSPSTTPPPSRCSTDCTYITNARRQSSSADILLDSTRAAKVVYPLHLPSHTSAHVTLSITLIAPPASRRSSHACNQNSAFEDPSFKSGTIRASHQSRLEASCASAARQCLVHGTCAVTDHSAPTPTTTPSILAPCIPALPTTNLSLPTATAAAAATIRSDVLLSSPTTSRIRALSSSSTTTTTASRGRATETRPIIRAARLVNYC